jgi:hypothetical protein
MKMKVLTVKEIKKIIDILPDESEVRINADEEYLLPFGAGINNDEKTGKSFHEILA